MQEIQKHILVLWWDGILQEPGNGENYILWLQTCSKSSGKRFIIKSRPKSQHVCIEGYHVACRYIWKFQKQVFISF